MQAAALASLMLLVAKGARADDKPGLDSGRIEPQVTVEGGGNVILEEDEEGYRRRKHEPLFVGLDFLLGFGQYTAVDVVIPQSGETNPTYQYGTSQIRTETFLLLGHYRFKHFGFGVRMPIIVGHIADPGGGVTGNDIYTNGNLELSLDMPHRVSPQVRYIPQIALTLPISQGETPPYTQAGVAAVTTPCSGMTMEMAPAPCSTSNAAQVNGASSAWTQYDHYAVGLAAAYARGGEDDALFLNWRLGITPKITLDGRFGHTIVQAYAKLPIMISFENNVNYYQSLVSGSPSADEPLRIEAVGGVRVAQAIGPLQVGVRVVGMVPIAARTSLKTPMLAAWPEIRLQLTPSARFWLGAMIPLAGDYNVFNGQNGPAPGNIAFQGGLAATF